MACRKLSFVWLVAVEIMMEDAGTLGLRHELRSKAKKPPCRNGELQSGIPVRWDHVFHEPLASAQILDNDPVEFFRHVDDDMLHRLTQDVGDALVDNFRRRNLEFISLAAHRLDEYSQMQFSASADLENIGTVGQFNFQTDVGAQLTCEPLAQITRRDIFSFLYGERRIID